MSNNFAWVPWDQWTVTSTTNTLLTSASTTNLVYDSWQRQPVVYRPPASQFMIGPPIENAPIPETPQQWLERRVAEIAWRPE